MASARDLRNKIRSVKNTKKITRTMELVATSKAKKAQDRVVATRPYSQKLAEVLSSLARTATVRHPLLEQPSAVNRTALLTITANRGLCGGYNTAVLQLSQRTRAAEQEAGRDVDLYMVGKKGISRMRYWKVPMVETYTHIDDRPSFAEATAFADIFMRRFLAGEIDRALVVSTMFVSAGTQRAEVTPILPITPPAGEQDSGEAESSASGDVDFIFEPDPAAILEALLPLSVRNAVYRCLVNAAASEQIQRRMAMKRATDNAEEMIEKYTGIYNRTRQAGITQQIMEIVGGASALG